MKSSLPPNIFYVVFTHCNLVKFITILFRLTVFGPPVQFHQSQQYPLEKLLFFGEMLFSFAKEPVKVILHIGDRLQIEGF
ncbi:MAG: hypothetical protein Q8S18_13320 [Bacteroidales bacterium]|nr:hypothetical protein [Bacteroidales bacterium]